LTAPADRPLLMGIINVTPDSFSDGGRFLAPDAALRQAERLVAEGADILDVGAESTRPGARALPQAEELERLLPVLRGCVALGKPVSVDTYKPAVMREAAALGAAMINDIWGFRHAGAFEAAVEVAASGVSLAVMHMHRDPASMQDGPEYTDVVAEVHTFLAARVAALRRAGVAPEQLAIDPGFGFGKTVAHNLSLLRHLAGLRDIGVGVLAGLSRKSTIGAVTGRRLPDERVFGSVAAALIAAQNGATILRVHDVAATRDALCVWEAVRIAV
jgi:dihydropteroate synthase